MHGSLYDGCRTWTLILTKSRPHRDLSTLRVDPNFRFIYNTPRLVEQNLKICLYPLIGALTFLSKHEHCIRTPTLSFQPSPLTQFLQRASVAYGWGILCLAGGGAYYFAKRSINADREERAALVEQRRQQRERLRVTETALRDSKIHSDDAQAPRAPNAEHPQSRDPVPVEHAQESASKFEAKAPWRSRKGDRFS